MDKQAVHKQAELKQPVLSRIFLFRFGFLRIPLAMLELPTFVLLPSFYAQLGLSLTAIGAALFSIRLLDAFLDPYLGNYIDRSSWPYRRFVFAALPLACLGFYLSFHPLVGGQLLLLWLLGCSILTYFSYSLLSIAYQAWGARLGEGSVEKTRLMTWREGLGLAGVLVASALLKPESIGLLTFVFCAMTLFAGLLLIGLRDASDASVQVTQNLSHKMLSIRGTWALPWRHRSFGKLLLVFVFNGVASAVPATLLLFFVKDVLQLSDKLPWFLMTYFASAALGMPLWMILSKRFGLVHAWMLGMICAILAFVGASALGVGDFWPYLAICGLTGLTLGADLAIPSALLAVLIADEKVRQGLPEEHRLEAAYFGLWSLASKANLALAAGLGLPLLALFGYQAVGAVAGQAVSGATLVASTTALIIAYAALPCLLKLFALTGLYFFRGSFKNAT
jgi:glycoside/pentoside/hexuronide:cation symporter, GPH family